MSLAQPPHSLYYTIFPSMEEHEQRELQLLLPTASYDSQPAKSSIRAPVYINDRSTLDLTLSMGIGTGRSSQESKIECCDIRKIHMLKKHAAEQIRLTASEKAYAERVRELTRIELELAEKEFARARMIWERAREEVAKAERMKVEATRRMGSNRIEIACRSCMQVFQP